jgi:hypothetical protein
MKLSIASTSASLLGCTPRRIFLGQLGNESLDEVEPGRAGWGEVQVIARTLREPALHYPSLVRRNVVEHEVYVEIFGHRTPFNAVG